MKRISKFSILAVGALVVIGSFSACSHRGDPNHRAQWMLEKVTKKLELDDAQQVHLKNVSEEVLAARVAMKQQFGEDREQLLALLEQPTLDRDMILSLVRSRTEDLNERAPDIVAAVGEFYDGLTVAQQAQIREFVQEHQESRHHRGQQQHD
jgi:protein CpxP